MNTLTRVYLNRTTAPLAEGDKVILEHRGHTYAGRVLSATPRSLEIAYKVRSGRLRDRARTITVTGDELFDKVSFYANGLHGDVANNW